MQRSRLERAKAARARESLSSLQQRALDTPAPPALSLNDAGFDVIAEIKRRSPAEGALAADDDDVEATVAARAAVYADAGACAISVLTEPERFDGDLSHLAAAAGAATPRSVPVMRKDFLTDPYQVFEARAAGAGGVLLITAMLSDESLGEMLDAAEEAGLFALIEAFDADDIERGCALASNRDAVILQGLNTRNLHTLDVDMARLDRLAHHFPDTWPAVAESGVAGPADAARIRGLGYRLALVGTALMRADDPGQALGALLAAGRSPGAGAMRAGA